VRGADAGAGESEREGNAAVGKKSRRAFWSYTVNTWGGGVKSTNCVKIATCTRLVSYNSEANVTIVKIAKPRR
jgi:hypothetical protein